MWTLSPLSGRRRPNDSPGSLGASGTEYPVETAEDILLAKLQWYQAGGEISERQWRDILGIVAGNPDPDLIYTRSWAAQLGLSRLLACALEKREEGPSE